jgi:hypothetical protein
MVRLLADAIRFAQYLAILSQSLTFRATNLTSGELILRRAHDEMYRHPKRILQVMAGALDGVGAKDTQESREEDVDRLGCGSCGVEHDVGQAELRRTARRRNELP